MPSKYQSTSTRSSVFIFNSAEMLTWNGGPRAITVSRRLPGSLILLPPGTEDRLRWHGSSDRLILSLRPDVLLRTAEELDQDAPVAFASRWSFQDKMLQQLVAEMGHEASASWPLGSLYADLLGAGLTHQLLRRHAANAPAVPEVKAGIPMLRLRYAMEYITANLHRDVRLEEIAHELNLSPFHFARAFRDSTGQTPYQYLLDQRMARAKHLLQSRNWTVQEIGTMTGFPSPVNFVRTFRQRIGQTPALWRKRI